MVVLRNLEIQQKTILQLKHKKLGKNIHDE